MTRDEIEFLAKHEMFTTFSQAFLDHDAEQRRVIKGLSAKVKNLAAWSDRMFGTPCAEIRHQQQVEMLEEKIKQQAQEIARLREALAELFTLVQGECPRLLNEDNGGNAELCLQIEQAINESGQEGRKNG